MRTLTFSALLSAALLASGCGDTSQGPSPSRVIIRKIAVIPGAPTVKTVDGPLASDVVLDNGGHFDDQAEIHMQLTLKDPGVPGLENKPSPLNAVTFTRYHVDFRRADGRNVQGVDVPFAFDGGMTVTVSGDDDTAVIEIVRIVAKKEAPLAALGSDRTFINSIATITLYGKDQAGNNVAVSGDVQVIFGNFADLT
jgi:hypothetical protein